MPAPRANGGALREVFRRSQGNSALDEPFAANIDGARESASVDVDTDPWRD